MIKGIIKIFFVISILGYLFLPLLQQLKLYFPNGKPLDGYFENVNDTVVTLNNWFEHSYQERKEKFLNQQFGFRPFLVRLNNEVNYSFFGRINVKNVFKGKDNYLFTSDFLDSYAGISFRKEHADSVFVELQKLNDLLIVNHKKLLVCFTPCKESFYPEYLPDDDRSQCRKETYYNYYRKRLLTSNIPFLDLNDIFIKMKAEANYPLFNQGALHWTAYGAALAMDTLFKRVRYETASKMNLVRIGKVEMSDTARMDDDDESKAMNLLRKVNTEKFAYPAIELASPQDSCFRPKVLVVGDSFYYGLNNTWLPLSVFSKESYFLYYYQRAISYGGKPDQDVSSLNIKKELENTDIVVLFFSVGTMNGFPYGATHIIN